MEKHTQRTAPRTFVRSCYCKQPGPHAAHYMGQAYNTQRYGRVEHWCTGKGNGPDTIEIMQYGDAACLAKYRYRRMSPERYEEIQKMSLGDLFEVYGYGWEKTFLEGLS